MSNIRLQGNPSGTGTLTIASPNTNSDFTFNLPAANGTIPVLASVTNNGVVFVNSSGQATSGSGLVFDGSNLGLGVTPSAWGGPFRAIQSGNGGSAIGFQTNGNVMRLLVNNFFNGTNYVYTNSAAASQFVCNSDGSFNWQTAGSGTAGNAISFTQAMTLDASGRLAIGTTSPIAFSNQTSVTVNGTNNGRFDIKVGDTHTAAFVGGSSAVEVAAITNVPIVFATNGTERARIDSSGNLLVGTTSNPWGARLVIIGAGQAAHIGTTSTTATGIEISVGSNGTGQNALAVYSNSAATTTMVVRSNGNVLNTNNSYGAISDAKLKENVTDATPKLAQINQVRVVNYNLIGETQKQIGVIAQELEQIFPGMVEEAPDRDAEGNDLGTTTKSVKYSVFVPMLIKAIQEQQAIIEQLTTRIAALEAK